MTSVLLQPGADGIDSVHLSQLRDWQSVVEAGYPWASVYLGGQYGVIREAIEAAWLAGIVLMLNYERSSGAAKGGYPAGLVAALTAINQAAALGFKGEAPLIFSGSDEDFQDHELDAAMEYHHAIVDRFLEIGWTGGAYGLRKVMELLAIQPWWPADWPIWHWGGDGYNVWWWAWVKQWYNRKPVGFPAPYDQIHDISGIPFAVDENTLFKPMRFWSGYGDDKIEPQEDPVRLTVFTVFDGEQELDAKFIGWAEDEFAIEMSWGDGWRIGVVRSKVPAPLEQKIYLPQMAGVDLQGRMPEGDRYHNWVDADFWSTQHGEKGDKGDPGPVPVSFEVIPHY